MRQSYKKDHEVTLWLRRHATAANPTRYPRGSVCSSLRRLDRGTPMLPVMTRHRRKRTSSLRRLRYGILLLLLIALVLECGAAVFTSPALHVRKVRVNGIEGLTPTEALVSLSQARVSPHSHIVLYPTERLAHSLQSLPWVAKASVRRHLPDTLEVQLIPRIPIALLVTREGKWELDANGIPIRMARSQSLSSKITLAAPAKIVFGRPVEVPGVAGAIAIAANNVGLKPLPITEIRVDQNAELCLNMRDGIQIQLGTADNLEDKLALIRRIYEGMPGIEEQMQMIDVRCPEAPACIPRTAEAAAPRSAKQDAAGDTRVNAYGASGSLTR